MPGELHVAAFECWTLGSSSSTHEGHCRFEGLDKFLDINKAVALAGAAVSREILLCPAAVRQLLSDCTASICCLHQYRKRLSRHAFLCFLRSMFNSFSVLIESIHEFRVSGHRSLVIMYNKLITVLNLYQCVIVQNIFSHSNFGRMKWLNSLLTKMDVVLWANRVVAPSKCCLDLVCSPIHSCHLYVGQTIRGFTTRVKQHCKGVLIQSDDLALYAFMWRLGFQSFRVMPLLYMPSATCSHSMLLIAADLVNLFGSNMNFENRFHENQAFLVKHSKMIGNVFARSAYRSRTFLGVPQIQYCVVDKVFAGEKEVLQWSHRKLIGDGLSFHNSISLRSLILRLAELRLIGWRWSATVRRLSRWRPWIMSFLISKICRLVPVTKRQLVLDRTRASTNNTFPWSMVQTRISFPIVILKEDSSNISLMRQFKLCCGSAIGRSIPVGTFLDFRFFETKNPSIKDVMTNIGFVVKGIDVVEHKCNCAALEKVLGVSRGPFGNVVCLLSETNFCEVLKKNVSAETAVVPVLGKLKKIVEKEVIRVANKFKVVLDLELLTSKFDEAYAKNAWPPGAITERSLMWWRSTLHSLGVVFPVDKAKAELACMCSWFYQRKLINDVSVQIMCSTTLIPCKIGLTILLQL